VPVAVHHGDSRDVLKTLADGSVASVVTDPPYALISIGKRFGADNAAPAQSKGAAGVYARAAAGFMGQKWDTGETAFDPDFWREVWRVLKPGAHVLAFSGTRTYHRMACAIEDAGFEIRDQIGWAYGSGFPKSHNVGNAIAKDAPADGAENPQADDIAQWAGWGTALKPAWEPICVARKPLIGTVAANVIAHGAGALNIDACRLAWADEADAANADAGGRWFAESRRRGAVKQSPSIGRESRDGSESHDATAGRWPANLAHDGSPEVMALFPRDAGGAAPASGPTFEGPSKSASMAGAFSGMGGRAAAFHGDSGSAARFFYCAKADAADRLFSKHPTVKPVALMRWLLRLVTPPGGVALDPFAGSGTTGAAAIAEGFDAILIEREADFVADIRRRIAHAEGADTPLFAGEAAASAQADGIA
jgi:site-specific DNA-methyltransferase (adenine-specific)